MVANDPRTQLMAIITAYRGGEEQNAGALMHEMSKHDLQRAIAFLIVSHIRLVEIVAPVMNTTADEIYRQLAVSAAQGG